MTPKRFGFTHSARPVAVSWCEQHRNRSAFREDSDKSHASGVCPKGHPRRTPVLLWTKGVRILFLGICAVAVVVGFQAQLKGGLY